MNKIITGIIAKILPCDKLLRCCTSWKFNRKKLVIPPPPINEFRYINKMEMESVRRNNEIFRRQGR